MMPWTEVSLGTIRRLDGDEDIAPRVLAMAISEKVALVWLLFGTYLKFK